MQGLLNQTQNVVDNLNPLQQVQNVQNQVDGLFQQQCGPIAPGQGFLPGGQLPPTGRLPHYLQLCLWTMMKYTLLCCTAYDSSQQDLDTCQCTQATSGLWTALDLSTSVHSPYRLMKFRVSGHCSSHSVRLCS